MSPIDALPRSLGDGWRYALLGGLASVPLTLAAYWRSGAGSELSLNAVFLGGLLAGYLAHGEPVDRNSVGVRAGVVGGLPGFLFLPEMVAAWTAAGGSLPFRVAAGALVGAVFFGVVLLLAGVVGLVGAYVGNWLAGTRAGGQGSGARPE